MSYDEYLAYTDMKILATEYKEYEKYLDKIDNAYSKAINTYNSNARDFKELIDNVGRAYAWGDLDGWANHAQSGEDSPQNISGKQDTMQQLILSAMAGAFLQEPNGRNW